MADEGLDPTQEDQGGELSEFPGELIDQILRENPSLLPDLSTFPQDLDALGELPDSQEAPQPPPRAPEHPQPQGKVMKNSVISKVEEIAVAEVYGIVPETDDAVPMCASVPKAFSYMDATKGKTGVPLSATSHRAYVGTSSQDSAVPMNAGIEIGVPSVVSANPSTESQGARTGSQAINYIATSAVSEMYSIPVLVAPSPQTSSGTLDLSNQGGTQAGTTSNTVLGNGSKILLKINGTNIKLPLSMSHLVSRSGTYNGTTRGGVPPNPMGGTRLMSNQPSTSKIDFNWSTATNVKEEKGDESGSRRISNQPGTSKISLTLNTARNVKEEKEDEIEEEEEEEEEAKERAGRKRQAGRTQAENKNKRRRQCRKQMEGDEEEEEEEEEEEKVPVYKQKPSNDREKERRRKDAIRAKRVRDGQKTKMASLEEENKALKEENKALKEENKALKEENKALEEENKALKEEKEKREKEQEERDKLQKRKEEEYEAEIARRRTWEATILGILSERFNIFVSPFETPGSS